MESRLMHPLTKDSHIHYGAKCGALKQTVHAVPFHNNGFSLGLPENYPGQKHSQVVLTFIHVIHNAVVTSVGDAFVANIKIVPQRCMQNFRKHFPRHVRDHVEGEIFTIAQYYGGAYYHDITENLPRLSPWLDFLRKHTHIKIHTASKNRYFRELFKTLGLDPA